MILAVDAGNTRLKWGLHDAGAWLEQGVCPTAQPEMLEAQWRDIAPGRVIVSNVAGESVRAAITQACMRWKLAPEFIVSAAMQCGVRSGYRDPAQLGCDRWAALVGAWSLYPGASLVVNAGTAITVDALTDEGVFLGGVIIPGLELMRRALDRGTAGLPLQPGEVRFFPDNTGDAIMSGAAQAAAGAVERMASFMARVGADRVRVIVSGGAAPVLQPLLALEAVIVDNLVLEGLATIALEGEG
jgi:type III pantothenate kinase